MLVEPTGHGVRSEHRSAGDAKSLPDADAIAVAPAAFNAEHSAFPPSLRQLASRGVHVLEQAPSLVGSGWRPGKPSLGGREACPPASILNEGRPGHQRAHQAVLDAGLGCPSPSSPSSSDAPRAGFPQVERAVRLADRLSTVIELSRVLRVRVDRPDRPAAVPGAGGGAHFEAVDGAGPCPLGYSAIPTALPERSLAVPNPPGRGPANPVRVHERPSAAAAEDHAFRGRRRQRAGHRRAADPVRAQSSCSVGRRLSSPWRPSRISSRSSVSSWK
jgi:hypothetical protein